VPPPARPASSRRPGVTVNAADARLALATAYVGSGGRGERARGVGHGRPRAGHALDAGDRQSRLGSGGGGVVRHGPAQARQADKLSNNREATIVGVRRLDDGTGNFPPP